MRRFLSVVLVTGLVLPPRAAAAQEADAEVDAIVQADASIAAGDPAAAARLLRDELARVPEASEQRARRALLASHALDAYALIFKNNNDCATARVGLGVAADYLAQLEATYGPAARDSSEYLAVRERSDRLEQARGEHGCLTSAAFAAPAPVAAPEPEPIAEPAPPPARSPQVVPLVVVATLTATALAVSLGTGLSRVQSPFHGRAFARIDAAAAASHDDGADSNDVAQGTAKQMCAEDNRFRNGEVDDACTQWQRFGTITIAAGVAAGVFAIGTAVLAGSLIKRRQRQARNLQVGVAPRPGGGLSFAASLAF